MPVNFEAEPHQEGRSRMFSDNEVFSFLYGKTRPQAVNKDVVSAQSMTQASNTGKLCSNITLPCKPSLTHAQLRKDRLEHAWHSRQIHAILVKCWNTNMLMLIFTPSTWNTWYSSNFWICRRNPIPFNANDIPLAILWNGDNSFSTFHNGTFGTFLVFWHSFLLAES